MPKENRRSRTKYPALHPNLNIKIRYDELTDIDYIDKLNDYEKQWLNDFLEESVNANLKHKGKLLHNTKELSKKCYDRNNARNRDLYSKGRARGLCNYLNDLNGDQAVVDDYEKIIEDIDKKYDK